MSIPIIAQRGAAETALSQTSSIQEQYFMLPAVGAFDLKMRPRVFAASGVSFVHICLTTVSYNTLFINLKNAFNSLRHVLAQKTDFFYVHIGAALSASFL